MMKLQTENLRFLLWRNRELKSENWQKTLATWLRCSLEHAQTLLDGGEVFSDEERRQLRQATGFLYEDGDLQYTRLLQIERIDILHQNICFLIGELQGENQREVAKSIGVNEVTFSRWIHGRQRPHRSNWIALAGHFGLPYETNLEEDAIFLLPGPISDYQKRIWVQQQIDQISPNLLRSIFPALERLLRDE